MRRLIALAAASASAFALAACSSSSSGGPAAVSQTSPSATSTQTAANCAPPPALTSTPQVNKYPTEPKLTVARTTYTATIVTNCGTITVAMDAKKAPHTVNSFKFLASRGYFNDTPCPRVTTQGIYVLQCGDPSGTTAGGPGYTIPDENLAGATYPAGTVAMANTGQPHTGGSQFFFVYADTPLPPQYTPFGRVTSGLAILQRIASAGSDNSNPAGGGKPNQPVVIEKFTVRKG